MDDADLAARLDADPEPRRVTALPDGSIDRYYEVYGAEDERVEATEEFAIQAANGNVGSFRVSLTAREPGGQAVNAARQAHALGDETSLFGHLDDPVFASSEFGFETHSMGAPADIRVLDFADDELLLAENSRDVAEWTLADLDRVAESASGAFSADAVCWGNWASVEAASAAFRTLADRAIDGDLFLLDPGDVTVVDPERLRDLPDALRTLGDAYDVVVSANRPELRAMAAAIAGDAADSGDGGGNADESGDANDSEEAADRSDGNQRSDAELVATVRDAADATGVVMHEEQVAVAATCSSAGVCRIPNYEVRDAVRPTGAGDRFTAGLAHALARGWDWPLALGLGNLAAAHYVETGETGDRAALREFLRTHERKD